jgi:uncharacterized protein (DUF58 family)
VAVSARLALAALAGVLVVAAAGSWAGFWVVDLVLAVLVAVDLALAGSVRELRVVRSGDVAVRLGERARVTLAVSNPGSRRVRGMLRDAWPPSAGAVGATQPLDLPPGERRAVAVDLVPTRRGDRTPDRVTVRAFGPLGLAARQGAHGAPWRVRVLPAFASRKHLPAKLARLRDLDGRTPVLVRGQGTEFDSLREYVPGDDIRSIDWRASARAGDVVVRTWRPERDRHLLLVLDTGRTSAGRVGDAPRLDAAMDAALLLAALATRAGDRVDLIAFDRVLRTAVQGRSATEVLPDLVQAMATLEAVLVEPDWRALVSAVQRRAPHRSLVVLLSALDPAPVEYGLLPELSRLTARHQVVLASLADPRVAQMAAGRGDAAAVYGAAAGSHAILSRAQVGARLRRAGVEVVEGSPAELPPRLADTYLALKAAGRL